LHWFWPQERPYQEATTVAPEFKASEESIHHLLDVMQSRKVVETMSQQVDNMYSGMVNKALEGKDLTPDSEAATDGQGDG
jgi:hypothetical protein